MSEQDDIMSLPDIEFLERCLKELLHTDFMLNEIDHTDFGTCEEPQNTSPEDERCARLADRCGMDGNQFRILHWNPEPPDYP